MKRLASLALLLVLVPASLLARGRNEQDDDFVDALILQHEHGIDIARIAVAKAQHEQLRRMARKMIEDHEADIARLLPLRDKGEERGRAELADMPGVVGMDSSWVAGKSGDAFDGAFLTAMIEYHNGSIRMARDEETSGSDSEVKKVARSIAARQRAERAQLLQWQQEWK
jgi:uncharacterized protein (DUF305 family)